MPVTPASLGNIMDEKQKKRYAELKLLFRINHGKEITPQEVNELRDLSLQARREDQEKFGEILTYITELLYEVDPIGFGGTESGVPTDEYEIEASQNSTAN